MTISTVELIAPPFIPKEHFADANRSILDESGDCICTFCPESNTGAVFSLGGKKWSAWSPISLLEFLENLASVGVNIQGSHDFPIWFRACSPRDSVPALLDRASKH